MSNDPNISWHQADALSIQVDENDDEIWHTGHCNDLLVLENHGLVVATQTGGLWLVLSSGNGFALGDFAQPDFNSITLGPDGPSHIFAGGGGLFETDVNSPFPLLSWNQIQPLTDEDMNTIGDIFQIVIIKDMRNIVIACTNGVFWSTIPLSQAHPRNYLWRKAQGLPKETEFFGLIAIQRIGTPSTSRIITSSRGRSINDPSNIYHGIWESGDLLFKIANISGGGLQRIGMRTTSIAACSSKDPKRIYAASANIDGFLLLLLRSDDGGINWKALGSSPLFLPKLVNPTQPGNTLRDDCGNQGDDWNNSIAVCSFNPDLVALAWRYEGCFISEDGGNTWRRTEKSKHLHSDIHSVIFDPFDSNGDNIYLASDGGVALLPNRGIDGSQYISKFNRQLLNLQFQSWPQYNRQFYGSFSASPIHEGLIVGGLQDNGNVFCELPSGSWRRFARIDDGQPTLLLPTDHVLYYFNDLPFYQDVNFDIIQHRFIGNTNQIVPVTLQDPTFPQPAGLGQLPSVTKPPPAQDNCISEAVRRPTSHNDNGQTMYAIGGLRNDVFGFFSDRNGDHPHWEFLFHVTDPINDPDVISALFSETGNSIWVGTLSGRLFEHTPGILTEYGVEGRTTPPIDKEPAEIHHIVGAGDVVFASFRKGNKGFILKRNDLHFNKLANGLPNPNSIIYYGLELVAPLEPVVPAMIFAATDDKVYISRDLGNSWQQASEGLPSNPHCCDLRFIDSLEGNRSLYLSSFGRSIWRASI